MTMAMMPLSPKRSSRRNCSPNALGVCITREHVFLGVAPRGQIELVGLVDELHGALQADLVEAAPDQLHLQAAQIGRQIGRLRLQRVARGVGLIELACARGPRR